jgi:hypothetical protein
VQQRKVFVTNATVNTRVPANANSTKVASNAKPVNTWVPAHANN